MASFTPQTIGYTGVNPTYSAPDAFPGPNTASPGDRHFLHLKNAGGSTSTITIVVQGTTFEQANSDVQVVVAAGTERMFGPLNDGVINPTTGVVDFVVVGVTSVTCALLALPTPPPDLP